MLVALTVAACGGGGSTTSWAPATHRAAAAPRATRARSCRAGATTACASWRGRRRYSSTCPRGCAPASLPLVLGLHGAGQDARGFEGESGFTQVADEHHFVIAYPMSWRARGFWRYPEPDNARSGLRYLRATLDAVIRTQCVDRGRVLVTGISSGGRMTYAAGCDSPTGCSRSPPSRGARASWRPAIPRARSRSSTPTGPRIRSSPIAAAAPTTMAACATSWTPGRDASAAARAPRAAHRPARHAPGLARVPRRRPRRASAHRGRPARLAAARRPAGDRHRRRRGDLALLRGAAPR